MKRMVATCAIIVGYFIATVGVSQAHDFWIQPSSFEAGENESVSFSLLVGDGPQRERSQIPRRRILRYEAVAPDGARRELSGEIFDDNGSPGVRIAFAAQGLHMLVLETDNTAQSRLSASRYNEYAAAVGLTLALAERQRAGAVAREGSEIYRRCAKSIVRIGAREADVAAVSRGYELALEIVPSQIPLGEGEMSVEVILQDRPLVGALVRLHDLDADSRTVDEQTSDATGRAQFNIPHSGAWLFSVVWSVPRPLGASTDFETFFSSLSFST